MKQYFFQSNKLYVGANITLSDAIVLFKAIAQENPTYFSYTSQLAKHIGKVANTPVRNVGFKYILKFSQLINMWWLISQHMLKKQTTTALIVSKRYFFLTNLHFYQPLLDEKSSTSTNRSRSSRKKWNSKVERVARNRHICEFILNLHFNLVKLRFEVFKTRSIL